MSHIPFHLLRRFLPVAIILVMAVAVTSCGTSRSVTASAVTGSKRSSSGDRSNPPTAKGPADVWDGRRGGAAADSKPLEHIDFRKISLHPVSEKLLREADSWIGTGYCFGGNDRSGVDCSGFVVQVFKNSLGISLPRTSAQQQTFCDSIGRDELMPGDLVFFTVRGGDNVGHVGIYIGNSRMVHASSSKGVVISSIESNYYVTNYFGSGRVQRYYAMCGGDRKSRHASPQPEPVVIPIPEPAPPVYASAEQEVAETEPLTAVITTVDAASADDDDLTNDEQAAVKARVAMRVARFGKSQTDNK